uniref:PCI domain-containing protein n=1 Tax=Amphora coffeiformis TaxID=265554 RepID=A0A7S3L380_9STRA
MAYLDLCLKLFKTREAKDGLHQYRNLAQSQAPGSLEKVIRYLMNRAETQCAAAQAAVDQATLQQTTANEEEELGATPEAILLSTIAMDPAKSQRDSALLLPTLKFLWETYRAILDILRSSSKLEHVYHTAAQNALAFCRTYKRRVEFRHLTDMLRTHLGNLRQYGSLMHAEPNEDGQRTNNKVRGWEGWTTESIELHLQTRFAQLETASVLHRYTEGFRTCEDIFNILQVSQARRKQDPDIPPPKAKLMASYYEKLTTLFWVSENYLFHAFAWYKYYSLYKEFHRGMSADQQRVQASAVLLATLCIPSLPPGAAPDRRHGITSTAEDDIVQHKMARMATLLGFHTKNPTREALLAEIKSKHLLEQVPTYLSDLYVLLEENSDPLEMVQKAQPLLQQLKQEVGITNDSDEANEDVEDNTLGRYVKPLTQVLLLKLIVNLSKTYHTVSIDFLKKLTAGLGMSFEQVEKSIVVFTQTKTLTVRIDHRAGCLRFGNTQLESDSMRAQLTTFAKRLDTVVRDDLTPVDVQQARKAEHTKRQEIVLAEIRQNLAAEHQSVLERKNYIEQQKESEERAVQEKMRAEQLAKQAEEVARRKEEEERIKKEQMLREQEKMQKIEEELEAKRVSDLLKAMGKDTKELSKQELAEMDADALKKEHEAEMNRKKDEAERKTREQAKKLDHLVRAIRIEELPLVQKKYEERVQQERTKYEQDIVEKAEEAKKQWEADVLAKKAMESHSVFKYMDEFENMVLAGRKAAHEIACQQADEEAEREAEMAKFKRARKRKDEEMKRKAAEEARLREEQEKEQAEEEERKRREQAEQRKAEKRQADEQREQQEAAARGPIKYVPPSLRGRAGGGGGSGGGGPGGSGGSRLGGGDRYPGGGRYEGGGGRGDSGPPASNSRWRN